MTNDALDRLQEHYLRFVIAEGQAFEDKFGKTARRFFDQLPVLFHLYRRLALDLEVSSSARRFAASALLYMIESDDFLRTGAISAVESSIDNLWVGFEVLRLLRDLVDDEAIARHVNPTGAFEVLTTLAENIDTVAEHVPARVLVKLQQFVS